MLQAIMSVFPDEESDSEDDTPTDYMDIDPNVDTVEVVPGFTKRKKFKNNPKWRESNKMRKLYQILREESEGASGQLHISTIYYLDIYTQYSL
jgi:hypothetical protein